MRSPLANVWAPHIYLTPGDWSGLIYLFARININPGKNDAILMAGFVRSDTDTTPLGIMMMAQRRPLGMRMKMKLKREREMMKRWCVILMLVWARVTYFYKDWKTQRTCVGYDRFWASWNEKWTWHELKELNQLYELHDFNLCMDCSCCMSGGGQVTFSGF